MIKHASSLALCCGLVVASATGQVAPAIEWQQCFGGTGIDRATDIRSTSDGGFVCVAYAGSTDGDVSVNQGEFDFWILKFDATGALQWERTLGGSGTDWARSVHQTADGGYVIAGMSESNDGDVTGNQGDLDMWVVKVDADGDLEWQRSLGGSAPDRAMCVRPTTDGGYVVVGETFSSNGDVSGHHGLYDAWAVKLDAAGVLQWQNALGGSNYDFAYSVVQAEDGGYVLAGSTGSTNGDVSGNHGGLYDAWVVKLNAAGTLVWQTTLGGSEWDDVRSIVKDTDGGFFLAGTTGSQDGDAVPGTNGSDDLWLVKIDATGDLLWQQAFGGSQSDKANAVHRTADGGCVAVGEACSADGDVTGIHGVCDAWVVRVDAAGGLLWQRTLGGSATDHGTAIMPRSDGGLLLAGHTESNDHDVSGNHGLVDGWLVKLEGASPTQGVGTTNTMDILITVDAGGRQATITSGRALHDATLTLVDLMGRTVLTDRMDGSVHTIRWGALRAGCYVLRLASEEGVHERRVVLE